MWDLQISIQERALLAVFLDLLTVAPSAQLEESMGSRLLYVLRKGCYSM